MLLNSLHHDLYFSMVPLQLIADEGSPLIETKGCWTQTQYLVPYQHINEARNLTEGVPLKAILALYDAKTFSDC